MNYGAFSPFHANVFRKWLQSFPIGLLENGFRSTPNCPNRLQPFFTPIGVLGPNMPCGEVAIATQYSHRRKLLICKPRFFFRR
jgi:hypothetical protein